MRVAVIGAGAAGLVSARHVVADGHRCVVYEQNAVVGGTWVYDERTAADEYGLPVHSAMYKSLRTNLPKEIMGFPDFPIPKNEESYIPARDILKLINDYADHFNLRQYIQFRTQVTRVHPCNGGWDVSVRDVRDGNETTNRFDGVMVCNGHYWQPYVPELEGAASFRGQQVHSKDYRVPERFRDCRVLVIGAGPSGMDLTLELSRVAHQVFLSHHQKDQKTEFSSNVTQKPDVAKLTAEGAEFVDGSAAPVDIVVYCTGFRYAFPFLSEACSVRVEDNHVRPLYKHLIHVDHPTLCFVGLPFYVCAFIMFDLQARLFVRALDGRIQLPPREAMVADAEAEQRRRREQGLGARQAHMLGPLQGDYFDELAAAAGLERVPPVMATLHAESSRRLYEDFVGYREDVFRLIDEHTFERIK